MSFSPHSPSGKKMKKKLKKLPFPSMDLDESCEDPYEGIKKKKKDKTKKVKTNPMSDNFKSTETIVEGKKKKEKRLSLNGTSNMEDLQSKKKKDKDERKRKSSIGSHLNTSVEDTPMKKIKKKSQKEGETDLVKEEQEKSPKSPKKRKDMAGGEEMASMKSPRIFKDENLEKDFLPKSPHKKEMSLGKKTPKKEVNGDVATPDSCWSVEEELALIDNVLSSLKPKDDKPYRTLLRKMDWKQMVIANRSAEECREMMEIIIAKITKYKSLPMLLKEAREEVSDSAARLKKIKTAKFRFINEYTKKHSSEFLPTEIRAEASAAWIDLPRKEKRRFELEYEQEVQKFRKNMDLPPDAPKNTFQAYYAARCEKEGIKGIEFKNKCAKKFHDMNMKDKSKYIHESCKEWATYITEYKAYASSHPDWGSPLLKMNSLVLFKEYFEYLGMPKCAKTTVAFFAEELKSKGKLAGIDGKTRLPVISSLYGKLSEDEKNRYKRKQQKSMESFEKDYKIWKETADEAVKLVVETYFEKAPVKKFTFKNVVGASMARPKFSGEPEKPPVSALKIFSLKFEKRRKDKYKSAKELKVACELAWKALPEDSKFQYEERNRENRVAYKESLIDFVNNLGDVGKVYLGFKRYEFYNYFKEDIFEQDFPNEMYPVYETHKKEVGPLAAVMKRSDLENAVLMLPGNVNEQGDSSSNDETSDEENSSEVESEEDSLPSVTTQQLKTPVKKYEEEDDDDDDEEVLPSWQTPKTPTRNDDQEDDSDDEEDDDDQEDDDDEDQAEEDDSDESSDE